MAANNDALVMIFSRNAFYRRMYMLTLGALALAVVTIAFLLAMLSYLLSNPTKPVYFAADTVGRLIQIVPVNTPNMKLEEVIAWTEEAVESAFSYDFVNWRGQLQDSQRFFTNYGWSKYMNALALSGNLRALTERKQIISAQVVGQPKLVIEGILGGAYAWKFSMQLLVNYSMPPYDGSNQFSNALVAEVTVQRQPILSSYRGLGIVQLVSDFANAQAAPAQPMTTSPGGL